MSFTSTDAGGAPAEGWVRSYYNDVDAMRIDAYMDWHTDDVRIQYAKSPPTHGIAPLREGINRFWALIAGLSHDLVHVWPVDGDWTVVESRITYSRMDGRRVEVPCVTTLHRPGKKVDEVRIFMDGSSVLAD